MVVLKHSYDAAQMAFDAINQVYDHAVLPQTVLVKPNVGRAAAMGSGVCTHPEVVRGVVRFFASLGVARILVSDGPIWGVNTHEAMERTGIQAVCDQEGVECVDMDGFGSVTVPILCGKVVDKLVFSALLQQVDCIVSVPVMKTHMYTGVTLGIKNMKGCLYKMEKTKLHRLNKAVPNPTKGRVLDYGIADMAKVIMPDYTVIDGIVGLEGLGPSVGVPKNMNLVLASKNALACDMAAMRLMGFTLEEAPHIRLIRDDQQPSLSMDNLNVDDANFFQKINPFQRADIKNLEKDYPHIKVVEKGTCSACSAALMVFLQTHGHKLEDLGYSVLATGKDLTPEDTAIANADHTFFIGNCALKAAKGKGTKCCLGCPPIGSAILEHMGKTNTGYDGESE